MNRLPGFKMMEERFRQRGAAFRQGLCLNDLDIMTGTPRELHHRLFPVYFKGERTGRTEEHQGPGGQKRFTQGCPRPLRDGDGVSPQLLAKGMEKHGITGDAEQAALDLAFSSGWLQKGPLDEIQLTKKGFGLDFGQ